MTAAKSAKDEAQSVAAEVTRIEAVKEAAAAKKATLIEKIFGMARTRILPYSGDPPTRSVADPEGPN
eukprot:7380721-Prymnesium_polylepis.2